MAGKASRAEKIEFAIALVLGVLMAWLMVS